MQPWVGVLRSAVCSESNLDKTIAISRGPLHSPNLAVLLLSCAALTAILISCGGTNPGGSSSNPQPLEITTPSTLPSAGLGTAYSTTLAATGGTAPFTWSVNAGELPGGLTLSSVGLLSGTPTVTGTFSFTVKI